MMIQIGRNGILMKKKIKKLSVRRVNKNQKKKNLIKIMMTMKKKRRVGAHIIRKKLKILKKKKTRKMAKMKMSLLMIRKEGRESINLKHLPTR